MLVCVCVRVCVRRNAPACGVSSLACCDMWRAARELLGHVVCVVRCASHIFV